MVLNLVNQMRGMLQSHTHRNTLCLNLHLSLSQIAIDITCRMTSCQNHRTAILLISHTTHHLVAIKNQLRHLRLEVHLATTIYNSISHRLNHLRQAICSDMRMCISQNSRRGTMLTKHIQDFFDITSFLTTRIELAIRVGTSPTLTKTVVALSIHLLRLSDVRQILLALMHILTSFQHDRSQSQLNQSQSSKQSSRTCSHHDHLRAALHVGILSPDVRIILRQLVHIYAYL